jgi:hypothetical protein
MGRQPIGAGTHIGFMLRLRRDAGKTQVVAKFQKKALLVLGQVIEHFLHAANPRRFAVNSQILTTDTGPILQVLWHLHIAADRT